MRITRGVAGASIVSCILFFVACSSDDDKGVSTKGTIAPGGRISSDPKRAGINPARTIASIWNPVIHKRTKTMTHNSA